MKGGDVSNKTVRIAAANGALTARKRNGAASKRPSEAGTSTDVPSPDFLEAPITGEPAAIDSPMWPVHPLAWFQPDGAPSAPVWTGLAIEHQRRAPMPDFLISETAPFDGPVERDHACDALAPVRSPILPPSGLAPLGWDARVVCRKEGHK